MKLNLKTILNSDNYQRSISNILDKCSHKTKVKFALHCAQGLEKFYDTEKYSKVVETSNKCFKLVANWLLDPKSVTKKELETAANAANAANAAAYAAAYAAANTAYTVAAHAVAAHAANAAYAAAYAAAAHAANAANAAAYAANAAAHAAHTAAHAAYAANAAAYAANYDNSVIEACFKDLFYYLIKLYLLETDKNFKEEAFNLLYMRTNG